MRPFILTNPIKIIFTSEISKNQIFFVSEMKTVPFILATI